MAGSLGERVGGRVGYRTRLERKVGRETRVEVVTTGVLLRRLQRVRFLNCSACDGAWAEMLP